MVATITCLARKPTGRTMGMWTSTRRRAWASRNVHSSSEKFRSSATWKINCNRLYQTSTGRIRLCQKLARTWEEATLTMMSSKSLDPRIRSDTNRSSIKMWNLMLTRQMRCSIKLPNFRVRRSSSCGTWGTPCRRWAKLKIRSIKLYIRATHSGKMSSTPLNPSQKSATYQKSSSPRKTRNSISRLSRIWRPQKSTRIWRNSIRSNLRANQKRNKISTSKSAAEFLAVGNPKSCRQSRHLNSQRPRSLRKLELTVRRHLSKSQWIWELLKNRWKIPWTAS